MKNSSLRRIRKISFCSLLSQNIFVFKISYDSLKFLQLNFNDKKKTLQNTEKNVFSKVFAMVKQFDTVLYIFRKSMNKEKYLEIQMTLIIFNEVHSVLISRDLVWHEKKIV